MKKTLISILSLILAFITLSADISAEEVKWNSEDQIEKFLSLMKTDYEEAMLYKLDEIEGSDGGFFKDFSEEALSCFKSDKNYIIFVNTDYERWVKTMQPNNDIVYSCFFDFYTSDRKIYVYNCDIIDRKTFTTKEIIRGLGINDTSKIAYGEIDCFNCPEPTLYTFYEAVEGWNTINGADYYINPDGTLQTKSCTIDGIRYSFSSNGVCKGRYTGWTKSSKGRRYYKNGELVKNKWLKTKSGKRYYADEKGYVTAV